MAQPDLEEIEALSGDHKLADCVEIYLPKSIAFLSELYALLREKVTDRFGSLVLDGLSIYEVDGVFWGKQLWEQRTLVIRVMFPRPPRRTGFEVEARITLLGREIATRVASNEEEVWICHYLQNLRVFYGAKRFLR